MWQGQFCELGHILASGWGHPAREGSEWPGGRAVDVFLVALLHAG